MCIQKTTSDDLINRYGIAATLLCVLHTFVLASSSWTCEEDLSEIPYFVLYGWQFGCAISWICGSAIVRRSSRSPQGFGASLLVAWSHRTLVGINLFIHYLQQSYPSSWTYYREDRAILVPDYIGIYHVVIRAIIVTVGFVITHLSFFVYHLLLFSSIIYIYFAISYSPLKIHTKIL